MRNTYIDAGPHTPEQLIASVDNGLLLQVYGAAAVLDQQDSSTFL